MPCHVPFLFLCLIHQGFSIKFLNNFKFLLANLNGAFVRKLFWGYQNRVKLGLSFLNFRKLLRDSVVDWLVDEEKTHLHIDSYFKILKFGANSRIIL